MSSEAPDGWATCNFGEAFTLQRGFDLPVQDRVSGSIPIIASNGQVGRHCEPKVSAPGLVTGRSGTIGNVIYVTEPFWPLNTTLYVKAFHGNDVRFGYYFLQQFELGRYATGTGVPTLNRNDVHAVEVQLPPLPEQKKIAAILTAVDEAIAATDALIAQTRRIKQGVLKHLMTRGIGHTRFKQTEIGEIPEGWGIRKLGELADFINGRGFKPHEWGTVGLPIIRIQNLNGAAEFNYYNGTFNPKIRVRHGDLLFAWSGSRGTSFGPHIWHGEDGLLNYHTWKLELEDRADLQFIYYLLVLLTGAIEKDSHGASALVHMQKRNIVDYVVAYPGRDERDRIGEQLASIDESIAASEYEMSRLRSVKSALMSDLLTGRKRVSLP